MNIFAAPKIIETVKFLPFEIVEDCLDPIEYLDTTTKSTYESSRFHTQTASAACGSVFVGIKTTWVKE